MNKKTKDTNQNGSTQIYDLSSIRNSELFKKISDTYSPDLYYFCWLGYKLIEKKNIGIIFEEYKRKYVEYQACRNLSNIRIKNKVFTLVKITDTKFHTHSTEYKKTINLTSEGRKVWKFALEDGLWDVLLETPKQFLLRTSEFINYFTNHIFFNQIEYQKNKTKLDHIKIVRDISKSKSVKSQKVHRQPNIQEISEKNLEKYEFRVNYGDTKKKSTNPQKQKKNKKKPKRLRLPRIKDTDMLSFLDGKNDSVSLRSLEEYFLRETEFDQELSKLDKNARTSNRRRFKELVGTKVSEFKDYELIKYISRNNNGRNNNIKYIYITGKGKNFHKFVQKRIQFPLASMIKQYKAFQRRRV